MYSRVDAILKRLDLLSGPIGFTLVLFAGEWPLVLIGLGAMAVGCGMMTLLLIPVERAFKALFVATVPVTLGLQTRRPMLLYIAALAYAGGLFALWCSVVLSYFAAEGQSAGALLPALIWSFSVAMAPFRSKDHFTPLLLPTHSAVARGGYLAMIVAVAIVPTLHFIVILSVFGLMMVGAAITHGLWSKRATEKVLDEITLEEVREGNTSIASLTLFPTTSEASCTLIDAFADDARKLGYQTRVIHNATQDEVTAACLGAGAVIFDATRELLDDANYRRVLYLLNTDYAVIVSRNYLPSNFPSLSPIAPSYPTSCDNESLLSVANNRLSELHGALPRKEAHRGWRNAQTLMDHALEKANPAS